MMQDSVELENTSTHYSREYNVSKTTQASFLAKFNFTRNKLGQKRHRHSVPKTLCALLYIVQNTDNKLKQLLTKI